MRTRNGDITVRLNRWDEHYRSLLVCGKFPGWKREVEVTVSQSISLADDKPMTPTVNWPALGAMGSREARLFSKIVRLASEIAERMALVTDWARPEGKGWKWKQAVTLKAKGPGGKVKLCRQTSRPPNQRCPF